jgi:hypothetical protein
MSMATVMDIATDTSYSKEIAVFGDAINQTPHMVFNV